MSDDKPTPLSDLAGRVLGDAYSLQTRCRRALGYSVPQLLDNLAAATVALEAIRDTLERVEGVYDQP